MMRELTENHSRKKRKIKARLKEFKKVWEKPDKKVFSELCFCICTPQSKAVYCDKAVSGLEKKGVLFKGTRSQIRVGLTAVRFPNNKAKYIFETRGLFNSGGSIRIKEKIDTNDIPGTRDWLVRNVKGIGYKEASHFLRNIGFGQHLAILDVHILRNMVRYGVIESVPKNISRSVYLELENKLKGFAKKIGIPMDELDLLFWSSETGEIFK
ncbi:MAG: N-glycosylase/DNA lyase [Candidatus Omnitrophota bacterium]